MNAMVKGLLNAGHQVKVLSVNSNKYNVKPGDIPADYRKSTGIELVYLDLSIKLLPAFISLVKNESYHISRFISKDFESALTRILKSEKFDIIQFETLFTTPYIPLIRSLSEAQLVLRAHNIEHLIWKRIAGGATNPLKKWYIGKLAQTLENYEKSVLDRLDGVVAITGKDAAWFRKLKPGLAVIDIPFGIDPETDNYALKGDHPAGLKLFHLGSMNWMPNQEGIKWFLNEVWPDLHARHPELTFSLAGRAMPQWLVKLQIPGVIVDGEVSDARTYMQQHDAMIVPLFSGSGIRIKIIEGMLAGKTIVTTPVGAEGINYTPGKELLIATDAHEFAQAIEFLLTQPDAYLEIGQNARELVLNEHDNAVLMEKLANFYSSLA
jgi:glycosyltransferase involved in cell wall biosynthesis